LCQQIGLVERFSSVRLMSQQEPESHDFDRYCEVILPRLIAFGFRITRDQQDAEDIAIETLARTMLGWKRISTKAWRDAWVFRVAANLSIDVLRKQKRAGLYQEANMPSEESTSELTVDLRDVLAQLPPRQREVVVLRYWGDLTYDDIGRRLRISEGSVKTHLHRGMTSLRQLIKPHS
jgi:RNA polymerase sigma factor (sigma-70 family)